MKTYKDLNLKKLRDECGLDFAHYTYRKGMCSCCYGPKDMAKRYWKDGIIPESGDYTYILFKNAYNGSGRIKSPSQEIENHTCIQYRFSSIEQQTAVIESLQEQLGDDYIVQTPYNNSYCIVIFTKEYYGSEEYYLNEYPSLYRCKDFQKLTEAGFSHDIMCKWDIELRKYLNSDKNDESLRTRVVCWYEGLCETEEFIAEMLTK